ncbi:MAG: hypothetical protein DWQ44_04580 [Bacteroidetes bacterium]|nr:MAG: hypothetical protein DWQ33_11210 [Bacteroidota bacterium]REK00653.1 MAG: hypothetical protein DWQ39_10885 [Bacteroidota bacterium]REK35225.1 MAG: hypothetical protein DWQ44_04580 [Bacteroidota bacterium]REK48302.1 MAG: hypothetical protein DWQ48_10780 [Bacteroidota bacterium]
MTIFFTRFFSVVILSILAGSAYAQNPPIAIGEWREHIPYNKAISITESGSKVYCASQLGVFSYSKSDGEISLFSRLNSLSDFEVSTIRADQSSANILIAYQSSNVDILYPDMSIANLSDIKRKNIVGGKKINHILFLNNHAYLSCEFGIVVVDMNKAEIKDTYYIGPNGRNINVNGLAYDGTYLLAATDSGLLRASFNDPNIFNFTAWFLETNVSSPLSKFTSVASLDGKFYAVKTNSAIGMDTLLVNSNGNWTPFIQDATEGGHVDAINGRLMYRNNERIIAFDPSGNQIAAADNFLYQNASIQKGFLDNSGTLWIADQNNGLVKFRQNPWSLEKIAPNGPRSSAVWAIDSRGGNTWIASGSLKGDAPNYQEQNGCYVFSENSWSTFDKFNDNVYATIASTASPALISVAVDPLDPDHAYFACWGGGLLEYRRSGGVQILNASNSGIRSHSVVPNYYITGGVTFDQHNNLWVTSGGNTTPLSVKYADGSWQTHFISDIDMARFGLFNIIVDDFDQKWFIAREGSSTGQGLGVFHENDPANPNDNSFKRITSEAGKGALPDMYVRAIAKDKDGSIWIGTNKGVVVIYNPGNVFSGGNFDAQQIIIEQDGNAQYLLETEAVNAIAIDGANRKWFGTYSGGAFLMSADGTKQLATFNTSNSPLPSNSITAIAVDEKTGEVFFGTDKGIVSYRGEATEGSESCTDYYVFPNPVRHDYHGPVAIRGLVSNADVKIADISGQIVYHTKANGGQAIWNGKNFSGERVQTGIYTVFVTNPDGSSTCVTKLLFAN